MRPIDPEFLRPMPLFEAVSDDDLTHIARHLVPLEFEPGDLLFREGAPGRWVCFVASGELDVFKLTADGEEVRIAGIEAGRSVGEMSVIDGLTCSATVRAREPTRVMALSREHFDELLEDEPRIAAEIYKGISRLLSVSLRRTSEDLAEQIARGK